MALVSLKYKCICPWNVFKYCTSLQHRDHIILHAGQNCKQFLLLRWWMNLHWTDPAPSVWVSGAGRLAHRRTSGRICGSCAPLCSVHRFETSPADSEICILHIPCSTENNSKWPNNLREPWSYALGISTCICPPYLLVWQITSSIKARTINGINGQNIHYYSDIIVLTAKTIHWDHSRSSMTV